MKINWNSVGNSALAIFTLIAAYLLNMGEVKASLTVVLIGAIVKAVCSEINNQQTGVTTIDVAPIVQPQPSVVKSP